jgi:3-methylfumaryl-CoA hydratase
VTEPPGELRAVAESWRPDQERVDGRIDEWSTAALAALLDVPPPSPGDPLPLGWHEVHLHDTARMAELGPDGHRLGGLLPPLSARQRRFGGGVIEVLAPLPVGATARRDSRVVDVRLREGRAGWLLIVTEEHEIRSGRTVCVRDRRDLVYRVAEDVLSRRAAPAAEPRPAPAWDGPPLLTLDPDPRMLFLYSALTYNAHRIHYDADYLRSVEGDGRLLVHGPLVATGCAQAAQQVVGVVRSLEYRLVAPAFAGRPVAFHARAADDGSCAVRVLQDGRLVARASARSTW